MTDTAGSYRLSDLAPGTYHVSVDVGGFKPAEHGGVLVRPEATVVVDLGLELASVAETVKVSSNFSVVDVTDAQVPTRLSADLIANLPPRVLSDVMNLTPGVNVDIGLGGVQRSNPIFNDGVNATSVSSGAPWTSFNYNWVEDVEIVGMATGAQYGEFNGIIQKNRLRSGSNRFSGLAEYRATPPGWVGSNTATLRPSFEAGVPTDPQRLLNWWDVSAQIGGPLRRDELWFFAGVEESRDNRKPALYDGATSSDRHDRRMLGKIDSAVGQTLRLGGYYETDRSHTTGVGIGPFTLPEAASVDTQPNHSVRLNATWTPAHRVSVQLEHTAVAGTYSSDPTPPATRDGPYAHFDDNTFIQSGNSTYYDEGSQRRTYGADFVVEGNGALHAHELMAGVQHERERGAYTFGYPGGRWYEDVNGAPFQVSFVADDHQSSDIHRTSAYLQDRWSIAHRLTIHPGLRVSTSRGIVSQGTVMSTSPVSPRIGAAWDVVDDHKTVVRFHYGRYHDAIVTNQFSGADEVVPAPTITAAVIGPEQFVEISRTAPSQPNVIDRQFRQPFFDQYVAGCEQQLWGKTAFSAEFIRRRYANLAGYVDVGSIYQPVSEIDPGPDGRAGTSDDGAAFTAFRKVNPGHEQYLFTNPSGVYRRYSALQLIGRTQYGSVWQLQVSYTWSSTRGNAVNAVGSNAAGPDLGFNGVSADPNRTINADGPVPFDFTHEIKLLGVWHAPGWQGVTVGGVYQYHTGTAWSRTARFPDIQFVTFGIRMEPRGTRRTAALNTLDLRVEKTFDVVQRRLGVFVDALNVNNQGIPDPDARRPVNEFSGPTFGMPMYWMAPRIVRVGGRLVF